MLEQISVDSWWQALLVGFTRGRSLHAEALTLVLIIAVAVALCVPRATWRWFGLYVTFVHELGHALAALMTGRIVRGIRLNLNHSGETVSAGRGGAGIAWSGFWGYPAPAVAGAAMIWAASSGWAGAALSIGAILLLVALLFIRNLVGIVIAVGCAALAQVLVLFTDGEFSAYVVLCLGIALVVGAVKDWFKVAAVHVRRRRLESSDAYILARATGVPAAVWLAGFALVIIGCAYWSLLSLGAAVN
ncbi:MAG: M50 family metallopeptidase [Arthrobacter sp.]|uniref:M50 family metallopeptidase n=1 Tax=unclassified Arthrobacter TaxID=235627 RepID=UPI00264CEEA5|nr:M50 family metallopeptidase [Micrococcaceae bacterium]MDN5879286.1 M50 family metallopeptidase [Micrococcaceae bacterium]MDN5887279.1 M50 family metallopeptidase [Micrococcaceae bacterium]